MSDGNVPLHDRLRIRGILRFHIPLGITNVLMASSHSIVNSGLARTDRPEIALAAYALGHTVGNLFCSPLWGTREMLISFGTDRRSLRSGLLATAAITGIVLAAITLLGYSGVGHFVFVTVFGAREILLPEILGVVRLCVTLPFIYSIRSWAQAALMSSRKTEHMTVAMISRLGSMLVMAAVLPGLGILTSTMVGAVIWIAGMAVETLVCAGFALRLKGLVPEVGADGRSADVRDCFVFLGPMILNGFLGSLVMPVINAGLARTDDPERNLAVFQVAWNLAWAFCSFVHMTVRQTVLVFLRNLQWMRVLRRFTRWLQYANSTLLVLILLTRLSDWLLVDIIGLEPALLPDARTVMMLFVFYPYLSGLVDFKSGVALYARKTGVICGARIVDLAVLSGTVFLLTLVVPAWGAVIGALAMMTGISSNYGALHLMMPDDAAVLMERGLEGD